MSEPKTQQEPSMEEILASIRRIISEDGADDRTQVREQHREPEGTLALAEEADDEVLELTEMVEEPEPAPPPEPRRAEAPRPVASPPPRPVEHAAPRHAEPPPPADPPPPGPLPELAAVEPPLVSARTEDATAASFTRLQAEAAEHALASSDRLPVGDANRTLEDMVKELLRPMLRQWLDDNLPAIVEAVVEREVERMGRSAHRR